MTDTPEVPIADAIAAVRRGREWIAGVVSRASIPLEGSATLDGMDAAIAYLEDYERVVAEVKRLNDWADGFSDAQLKERRLCEERIRKIETERDAARAELAEANKATKAWSAEQKRWAEKLAERTRELAEALAENERLTAIVRLQGYETKPIADDGYTGPEVSGEIKERLRAPPSEDAMKAATKAWYSEISVEPTVHGQLQALARAITAARKAEREKRLSLLDDIPKQYAWTLSHFWNHPWAVCLVLRLYSVHGEEVEKIEPFWGHRIDDVVEKALAALDGER